MSTPFKYDLAISFAEEDAGIASSLAMIFEKSGLTVFYYKYEKHIVTGQELPEILPEVYEHWAKCALVIISEHYIKKRFTLMEFAAIKARRAYDKNYLIPVRIGNVTVTDLDGMTADTVYYKLGNDYRELTELVLRKYFPAVHPKPETPPPAQPTTKIGTTIINNFGSNSGNMVSGTVHGGMHAGTNENKTAE